MGEGREEQRGRGERGDREMERTVKEGKGQRACSPFVHPSLLHFPLPLQGKGQCDDDDDDDDDDVYGLQAGEALQRGKGCGPTALQQGLRDRERCMVHGSRERKAAGTRTCGKLGMAVAGYSLEPLSTDELLRCQWATRSF